jgi:glycosyltransferase involved in cell wall biosynthesis
MRIAYVVERDLSTEDAVVKKIAAQMRCWREMGHEAGLFALSPSATVTTAVADLLVQQQHRRGRLDWLTRYRRLIDEVIAWQPSCAYFRFSSYFPAVGRLMRAVPTVVEVNTDDVAEYRTTMTRRSYAYHRLTRGRLFRLCGGVVTMTHELAEIFAATGKPVEVVANGIDLASFDPLPAPNNPAPRLAFLGSPNMLWHGLDEILKLAELNPTWQFDLIGIDRRAHFNGSNPANIHAHGYLGRADYEPLLATADVALGTLALWRKEMTEASPLKLREYLAYGIPTIIAYRDTDFADEQPFLLSLPNQEGTIEANIELIRRFVTRVVGTRVPRAAIGHLDIHEKEKQRLHFLESVCDSV